MNFLKLSVLFSFILALTACVSAPPIQQPITGFSTDSYDLYRSPLLDQTNHMLQHLNKNKDILYFQNYGGGGVGVGLLLGPLGVAANIKMIESNTLKDVGILKDKIAVNPDQLFLNAATESSLVRKNGASNILKLNPYLLIQKTENDVLMLASVILIDSVDPKVKTQNKYLVQIPVTYSISEISTLNNEKTKQLEKLVEDSFVTLISRIQSDSKANLSLEEKITLTSEFLTPRFKFEMSGNLVEKNDTYTWIRVIGGVYGVRNSDISLKVAKKK
jgi:hypothetical protein